MRYETSKEGVNGIVARGQSAIERFASDVEFYLTLEPRQLPSRYLYDELGSALFEAICRLPWYPITRAETSLLARHGAHILDHVAPSVIVELGSGSGDKLGVLLQEGEASSDVRIHLVDLSQAALEAAVRSLATDGRRISTHQSPYEEGLLQAAATFAASDRALVLLLGSNIGNFDPPARDAFLRGIRRTLRPGDGLLLGADLVKPEGTLLLAYDDPLGVTAAFNRNLLVRVNRELGGDFAIDGFHHRVVWNGADSRVEMHLVAASDQCVHVARSDLRIALRAGEPIWTESSYKYRDDEWPPLLEAAGFGRPVQWIDHDARFALLLAKAV